MSTDGTQASTCAIEPAPLIYVVDDDAACLKAVSRLLRVSGYRVRSFFSAEEILTSGKPEEAACLVVDVQMPDVSGLELQHRLNVARSRVPIVFVTGNPDQSVRSRALAAGALAVLEKPFGDIDLLRAVGHAVAGTTAGTSAADHLP